MGAISGLHQLKFVSLVLILLKINGSFTIKYQVCLTTAWTILSECCMSAQRQEDTRLSGSLKVKRFLHFKNI